MTITTSFPQNTCIAQSAGREFGSISWVATAHLRYPTVEDAWVIRGSRVHGIGVSDYYGSYMSIMHDFCSKWGLSLVWVSLRRVEWLCPILHANIQSIISLI